MIRRSVHAYSQTRPAWGLAYAPYIDPFSTTSMDRLPVPDRSCLGMIIDTPIWSGIGSPWTSMEFSPFRRAGQTLGPTHWGRRQRSVFGSFLLISPAGAVESDQKPPRAPSISSGLCPSPTLETSGIWNPMRGSASPSLLHLTSEALRKRAPSRALGGLLWSTRARGAALGSPKLMGRSECFQEIPLPSARPRCRPMTPFSSHRYNYVPSMEC